MGGGERGTVGAGTSTGQAGRWRGHLLAAAVALAATLGLATVNGGDNAAAEPGDPTGSAATHGSELVSRIAGATRIETAVELSQHAYDSAATVVLARSDLYPDALAGAPLAHALDAPILLTPSDHLASAVAAEIARLGAETAILLGGENALEPQLASELQAAGLTVDRIAGSNRYDTARLVAQRVGTDDGMYVVEGHNADPARGWPDAVSVSGLAAFEARPILLATRDALPEETESLLRGTAGTVTIVGGEAAVSAEVADALARVADEVERLAGANRYETARAVADRAVAAGFDTQRTWLVSGDGWPDALVAGPVAAAADVPVLLVPSRSLEAAPVVRDWILAYRGLLEDVRLIGGPAAISEAVEAAVRALLDAAAGDGPDVSVTASDITGLSGSVAFPAPRLWEVAADGEVYTQVAVPGIDVGGELPERPAVPTAQLLVAVPEGAEVAVDATASVAESHDDVLLLPGAHESADSHHEDDERFATPPFARDEAVYAADRAYPEAVATVRSVGSHRGLDLAQVTVAAGSHNPVARTYDAYDAVAFEVSFTGGEGHFVTSQAVSLLEPASRLGLSLPLNAAAVLDHIAVDVPPLACPGEELMVLTHPDFAEPAAHLAEWKNDRGLVTTVFEVGWGTDLWTVDDVTALIRDRYDSCLIRPSYVLLLGGVGHIPSATAVTWHERDDLTETIATDLPYGHLDPPDLETNPEDADALSQLVPDLITGRIPADTVAQAQTAVDKIIAYESSPPTDPAFYERTTHAGEFECCRTDLVTTSGAVGQAEPEFTPGVSDRTFIEASEYVRDAAEFFGYDTQRIYARTTSSDYDLLGIDDTPLAYNDQTPLPADLLGGLGWDGSTADIIDAFDDGSFLVTHRDHGAPQRWSTPAFRTSDVEATSNGDRLPVIWSINCSTGQFDGASPSLAEAALFHDDGGAVGVIAASGLSPSTHNTRLTRALTDTVWPVSHPGLNPVALTVPGDPRIGDMLHQARLRMLALVEADGATAGYVRDQYLMYHVIGDPTLQMWTSQPDPLPTGHELTMLDGRALVDYPVDGASVTLWESDRLGTRPIGRATVEDGQAEVAFEVEPSPLVQLQVSVDADDRVPRRLTPHHIP